jgi:regulatory protein
VGTARTIALRKLTASARTRHELDDALQKKNVPEEIATTVLDRLEEVGLVDDEAFAQSWVESRQQRRHLSRSALRRELTSKGVDRDHVDAALSSVDAEDELTAARALVAKKAAATQGLDPVVRHRRLAGVLARRGFGSGIISTVLAEVRADGGA